MQGLPIQLSTNKSQTAASGSAAKSAEVKGAQALGGNSESGENFSSLFNGLTSTNENTSVGAKAEKGDALKNILNIQTTPTSLQSEEGGEEEIFSATLNEKEAQALLTALSVNELKTSHNQEQVSQASGEVKNRTGELAIGSSIAKSSNNLDELLKSLKGTVDSEMPAEEELLPEEKGRLPKADFKSENPLEFLIKGSKEKQVSEKMPAQHKTSDIEALLNQKSVVTGEDYLNNLNSTDKKLNNKIPVGQVIDMAQKQAHAGKVKGYGQGLSLLADPLIKTTKDLAFKEKSVEEKASGDILKSSDMNKPVELSSIKQDILPVLNLKENTQQFEMQTNANQKVLDLGKLNTANSNEIIKKISDYVEQNQVANSPSLDLAVRHDSLGEFKIHVTKMPTQNERAGANLIDMQITTTSKEGHDFFVKNEIGLMKNLNNAGINLSDLRIVSSMSDSTFSGQTDARQQHHSESNFSSKQFATNGEFSGGDFSNGKERRKELWQEYQQRYGA